MITSGICCYCVWTEMPVSSPPYKDVPVAGQVQVLSPRPLSMSVPQTSNCSVYHAPELITAHAHTSSADEPSQQDSSAQCHRPVSTSPASVRSDGSLHFFNTHSPPLLNLSPNLSPSMSDQVMPPCYDLRESTRRQSSLYGEGLWIWELLSIYMETSNLTKVSYVLLVVNVHLVF